MFRYRRHHLHFVSEYVLSSYPQNYQQSYPRRVVGHRMKPIESNVSPYLQQPLRSLEQVRQEREQRQRELANAAQARPGATPATTQGVTAPATTAPAGKPAGSAPVRVDQTV